jgi:hypothetical protein
MVCTAPFQPYHCARSCARRQVEMQTLASRFAPTWPAEKKITEVTQAVQRSTVSCRTIASIAHDPISSEPLLVCAEMKRVAASGPVAGGLRTMAPMGPERATVAAEVTEAAALLSQSLLDKGVGFPGGRTAGRPAGDLYELLLEADRGYAFPQPGVRVGPPRVRNPPRCGAMRGWVVQAVHRDGSIADFSRGRRHTATGRVQSIAGTDPPSTHVRMAVRTQQICRRYPVHEIRADGVAAVGGGGYGVLDDDPWVV